MTLNPSELRHLEILAGVDLDHIKGLLERCRIETRDVGDVLLTMGEPNEVMYMILEGRLSVHLEGGPLSEPVAYIEAGQTVGELSVLDMGPASAYVIAARPTRLLVVDQSIFWNLADASHDFSINLLVLLAQRLRMNNSTVSTNIRLQRQYKRTALVDALTGLYNRRWLDEALPRFTNRFEKSNQPLSLLMVDIDHFKLVNDQHGHPAGDAVLVNVAHTLRATIRPTDHVARFGGEEFAILLPDTDSAAAITVAERVRVAVKLSRVTDLSGNALPSVTISVGGAALSAENATAPALLAAADVNLFASKQNGRDRVTMTIG